MISAGYLLCSTNMRVVGEFDQRIDLMGLENGPPTRGNLNADRLRERVELVFQVPKRRLKNLVIVNSNLSEFDMIQTCVEVADKYADNVMVVPPIIARLAFALEKLSNFRSPPSDEVIIVITITEKFAEYTLLQRDKNFELYIERNEEYKLEECEEMFEEYYNYYQPHAVIFVAHDSKVCIADRIKDRFRPQNTFVRPYKKWDYVLLLGAVLRAMDESNGFDTRYHLANFSSGYLTNLSTTKHTLLKERTPLPCEIHGINGKPQQIRVRYFVEYYQIREELVQGGRIVVKKPVWANGSPDQVIGYVDERGVPFIPPPANRIETSRANESSLRHNYSIPSDHSTEIDEERSTPSNAETFSYASSLVIERRNQFSSSPTRVTVTFAPESCAVEILRNGQRQIIRNNNDNEWIPLYLSSATSKVEIGEKAREDYKKAPKSVIFDIMKVIGKQLDEIQLDPKWGFELTEQNGVVYFQIETSAGQPKLIPQEIVLAAFFKFLKVRLESENLGIDELKEIRLSTETKLSESQKAVFQKAADKIGLEIASFDCYVDN